MEIGYYTSPSIIWPALSELIIILLTQHNMTSSSVSWLSHPTQHNIAALSELPVTPPPFPQHNMAGP